MSKSERHFHVAENVTGSLETPNLAEEVSIETSPVPVGSKDKKEVHHRDYIDGMYHKAILELNDFIEERDKKIKSEKDSHNEALPPLLESETGSDLLNALNWNGEITSIEKEKERLQAIPAWKRVGTGLKKSLNVLKRIPNAEDVTVLQQYIETHVSEANARSDGEKRLYHPDSRVVRRLSELLHAENDPVTTLGKLNQCEIRIDSHTFKLDYFESLKWFIETPGALATLEQLITAGFSVSKKIGSLSYDSSENALETVKKVLEDKEAGAKLQQYGQGIQSFLAETGIRISPEPKSIEILSRVYSNPEVKEFCKRYSHAMKSEYRNVAPILNKISEFSEKGLLKDIECIDSFIKIDDLLYRVFGDFDNGETEDTIQELKPIIKDAENRKHLEVVSRLIGKKFNPEVLLAHAGEIRGLSSHWKEAFAGLTLDEDDGTRILKELSDYNAFRNLLNGIDKVKKQQEYQHVLESSYMQEYTETIGKIRPFQISSDWSNLQDFFSDNEARQLMTPEGLELLEMFPADNFLKNYRMYARLLKVEGMSEKVERVNTLFESRESSLALCYHLDREGVLDEVNKLEGVKKILGKLPWWGPMENSRCYSAIIKRPKLLEFIDRFIAFEGHEEYTNWSLEALTSLSDEVIERPIPEVIGYMCVYSSRTRKFDFLNSKKLRGYFFDEIYQNPDFQGSFENEEEKKSAVVRTKNIQHALSISETPEQLGPEMLALLTECESKYGPKGKSLMILAIVAYGIEDQEEFKSRLSSITSVLDMYDKENIPECCRVTFGIEYEVINGLADAYAKSSCLGYKGDIELVTRAVGLGAGRDAVHEIATRPTDNPYMLIAEIKLLQDAGFLDFNFEKYPLAARGFHLNLGGESGLRASYDAEFLNNIMTMAGLAGVNAGNELSSVRGVSKNVLDEYFTTVSGDRVEMKGMGGDSFEQFEQSILTSYHAGIAMQLGKKYLAGYSSIEADYEFIENIPRSEDDFENFLEGRNLLKEKFASAKERSLLFAWLTLKKDALLSVREHNQSFADSEFRGYVITPEGEYVDTADHIDIVRNQKLLEGVLLDSDEFNQTFHIPEDLLFQSGNPKLINPIVRANNLFLKGRENKNSYRRGQPSSVNAASMLSVMKREGYKMTDDRETPQQSIFDRGGRVRDGYYSIQGASEEMISHKLQIKVNRFNKNTRALLNEETRDVKKSTNN